MVLIFILHSLFSFSQTWPKTYGENGKYDYSEDIIETYDKGYIICGNIHNYGNETTMNAWIIKTDVNGVVLWEKVFDNDLHLSIIASVDQTNDGGILICGSVRNVVNKSYPWVQKLNMCGEKEWCKIFATSEKDNPWAQDIKETLSGEIIVLMNEYGENNVEDMILFKLSPFGEVLWQSPVCSGNLHPEGAIPFGRSISITSQKEYLIAGDVYWEDPWNPGGAKPLRPLFALVDSLGNEKWVLPFGLNDTIHGTGDYIFELDTGGFVGIGSYWTNQVYVEPLFMKFDADGNALDHQILYTSEITPDLVGGSFSYLESIESKYYSGGSFIFPDNNGSATLETKLELDVLNFVFTPLANKIYAENGYPYTLGKTTDNKLLSNSTFKEPGNWDISLSKLNLDLEYDTLYPGTYTYDSLCTEPGLPQSGFIFLDDCDIITGIDVPSPEEYYAQLRTIPISVYPNPTIGKVNFAMGNTQHHNNITLKCFNLMGKQVFETPVASGQTESSTAAQGWPQGIYVAVVYSDGLPRGECKFVVR